MGRDQIRDWVLGINMDGSVGQSLPTRRCEHGDHMIYENSLTCNHCRAEWEPCIITGAPLIKTNAVHCKICNKGAIREHWNDYIQATMHCPWCKSSRPSTEQQKRVNMILNLYKFFLFDYRQS